MRLQYITENTEIGENEKNIFQLDVTEVTNCYIDDYEITSGALFHKQSW